jgi:hypothetical protein
MPGLRPPGSPTAPFSAPSIEAAQNRETALSEKVVWHLIRPYAEAAGVAGIAPHEWRRYAESRIMPNPPGFLRVGADFAFFRAR